MTQPIQNGYLLIADISGFTSFIADTELDHAQAIIRQVLDGLLRNLTPTMNFCEVEGDAVFVYGLAEQVSRGELIAELIESTYAAFRDQQRTMIRNATCPCQACRAISGLDLKFVVHYGEFVLQELAGKTGPVGSSVNLVHALLKNRVGEQTAGDTGPEGGKQEGHHAVLLPEQDRDGRAGRGPPVAPVDRPGRDRVRTGVRDGNREVVRNARGGFFGHNGYSSPLK